MQFLVFLFVDGYASYITMAPSDFCVEHQLQLMLLYPNAIHILQPMDVSFFYPLKVSWKRAVHQSRMENGEKFVKKLNFGQILQKALLTLNVAEILKMVLEPEVSILAQQIL